MLLYETVFYFIKKVDTIEGKFIRKTCPCDEYPLKKIQRGKDEEKAQYLYHETYRRPNEQLLFQ